MNTARCTAQRVLANNGKKFAATLPRSKLKPNTVLVKNNLQGKDLHRKLNIKYNEIHLSYII